MRSSHLLVYALIAAAVLFAGSGMSADSASGGQEVVLPDLPAGEAVASSGLALSADAAVPDLSAPDIVFDSVGFEGSDTVAVPAPADGGARSATLVAAAPGKATASKPRSTRYFPSLLDPRLVVASRPPASVEPEPAAVSAGRSSLVPAASRDIPILANNQVLAFYGHPFSKRMGILGEYSKEDLARLLKGYAKLYDDVNGSLGVVPAFYLIYGTCWPGGEIGYLKDSVVKDYIEYAASQDMIVFVDHQIGKYPVEEAMQRLLPYLKYPNVHIALDPEWRTTAPMQEIGYITAEEVNKAQAMIAEYMDRQGIPGVKMLVVHQFKPSMIQGRDRVRADNERVLLVHTADGFGPPALKKNAYALNALANNMPLKGFKLFFKTTVPGAGYDNPLLTPPEVLALTPRPMLIIYQ
jgi:hypothetical protein